MEGSWGLEEESVFMLQSSLADPLKDVRMEAFALTVSWLTRNHWY